MDPSYLYTLIIKGCFIGTGRLQGERDARWAIMTNIFCDVL